MIAKGTSPGSRAAPLGLSQGLPRAVKWSWEEGSKQGSKAFRKQRQESRRKISSGLWKFKKKVSGWYCLHRETSRGRTPATGRRVFLGGGRSALSGHRQGCAQSDAWPTGEVSPHPPQTCQTAFPPSQGLWRAARSSKEETACLSSSFQNGEGTQKGPQYKWKKWSCLVQAAALLQNVG